MRYRQLISEKTGSV